MLLGCEQAFIAACDWLYLAIFTVELLLKVLAYGFLMHEGSYLRDAWCQVGIPAPERVLVIPTYVASPRLRERRAIGPQGWLISPDCTWLDADGFCRRHARMAARPLPLSR